MNHLVPFPGHFSLPSSFPPEQRAALARTTMGPPLPPHVLDLSRDPNPKLFPEQWGEFLSTVDWARNRFLRHPDEIIALDPDFVPYGHTR